MLALLIALHAVMADEKPEPVDFATGLRLPAAPATVATSPAGAVLGAEPVVELPLIDGAATLPVDPAAVDPQDPEQFVGPDGWQWLPDRDMGHLSLDWGLAAIGPGVLTPNQTAAPGGGGRGGNPFGGGQRGAQQGRPTFILPPISPGTTTPPPTNGGSGRVPEPASVLAWLVGGTWLGLRRRAKPSAPRSASS